MACLSAANGDGLRLLGDMPPWPHSSWRCAVCVGQTYYRQLHAADKKLLGSDERCMLSNSRIQTYFRRLHSAHKQLLGSDKSVACSAPFIAFGVWRAGAT